MQKWIESVEQVCDLYFNPEIIDHFCVELWRHWVPMWESEHFRKQIPLGVKIVQS